MITRHRSKRTKIENNESETRRCIIDEDLVPPQDLVIEILRRLPVKSLARFLLVSKLWSTIIRSQHFIRSFPVMSPLIRSQPPRLLFAMNNIDWTFSSSTNSETEEKQALSCLPRTNVYFTSQSVNYVNGLISLEYGPLQIIINPSTGKSITLPLIKSRKNIIKTFFGFDPIDDQYKVLCILEQVNVTSYEHQVFTLGGGGRKVEQLWRKIECNILHRPETNGVCINGVLYYGAFTGIKMREWCLMRFDVRTEKLNLLSIFNEINIQWSFHHPLINYYGKVALALETSLHRFELWVMDEDVKKWSKICFSIYHWKTILGNSSLRICDTIHPGEIVFVPYNTGSTYGVVTYPVFYYHKEPCGFVWLRKVTFDLGKPNLISPVVFPFLNYVESAMFL